MAKYTCIICGEEFDTDFELFKKYHKGKICYGCSREMHEDEIGYKNN